MADEDDKLEEELRKRWDPEQLSRFLKTKTGKAERLDLSTRAKYEKRFGVDLGDVRIFTGTLAEEITAAHNAEALTVGDTGMVLMGGSSRYAKGTAAGEALLAHELTHVAQAKPSQVQRKSVSDAPLATEESEAEAERVEQDVAQGAEPEKPIDAEKEKAHEEKRHRVRDRVMQLLAEDLWISALRSGRVP
jgi:hypothetical protein